VVINYLFVIIQKLFLHLHISNFFTMFPFPCCPKKQEESWKLPLLYTLAKSGLWFDAVFFFYTNLHTHILKVWIIRCVCERIDIIYICLYNCTQSTTPPPQRSYSWFSLSCCSARFCITGKRLLISLSS